MGSFSRAYASTFQWFSITIYWHSNGVYEDKCSVHHKQNCSQFNHTQQQQQHAKTKLERKESYRSSQRIVKFAKRILDGRKTLGTNEFKEREKEKLSGTKASIQERCKQKKKLCGESSVYSIMNHSNHPNQSESYWMATMLPMCWLRFFLLCFQAKQFNEIE